MVPRIERSQQQSHLTSAAINTLLPPKHLNRELSSVCDVMTVEIEHVNTEILDILVKEGKQIHPKPSTIRMIQVLQLSISYHLTKFL